VVGGLVALHILVLVVIVVRAGSLAPADADVARANRVATSPAIPYRNFPVEFMPLQTLFDRALGSGDVADAAVRIAVGRVRRRHRCGRSRCCGLGQGGRRPPT
jgi:hypothetical protein